MTRAMLVVCLECGGAAQHKHHVVPQQAGGKATVPLCDACHGVVHGLDMSTSSLTRRAMGEKKARGEFLGGSSPPFGWGVVGPVLVPVAHEQQTIGCAWWLRQDGLSLRRIAELLAERGLVSRRGRRFEASQIQRMVT